MDSFMTIAPSWESPIFEFQAVIASAEVRSQSSELRSLVSRDPAPNPLPPASASTAALASSF